MYSNAWVNRFEQLTQVTGMPAREREAEKERRKIKTIRGILNSFLMRFLFI
jgi:hypothetical protein